MADTEGTEQTEQTEQTEVLEEQADQATASEEQKPEEEESDEEVEYVCPEEFNEREEMCKMFVGGLDKETTDEEFKGLFTEYGPVKDFIIIRKENAKSERLFGFITFEKCDDLEKCLVARPFNYKDKELDVKRAVPRSTANNENQGHGRVKKLHIANIPKDFDAKTLKKYLKSRHPKQFGVIENINILTTKESDGKEKNRGFGFIHVSTEDFADRVSIAENKFTLDGASLRITKAKPRGGAGGGGGKAGRGGNWNNQGNYGNYNYGGWGGPPGQGYGPYGGGYGGYNYGGYYGGGYNNFGGSGGRGGGGGRFKPY